MVKIQNCQPAKMKFLIIITLCQAVDVKRQSKLHAIQSAGHDATSDCAHSLVELLLRILAAFPEPNQLFNKTE